MEAIFNAVASCKLSESIFLCHRRFKHFQAWRLQPFPPKNQGKETPLLGLQAGSWGSLLAPTGKRWWPQSIYSTYQFHVLNTRLWSINNPTESMNPSSELQKVAPFFPSEFCAWLDPRQAKLCKLCRQNKAQRQISGRGRFRIYIYPPPPRKSNISIAHSIHVYWCIRYIYLHLVDFSLNVGKNIPWMLRDIQPLTRDHPKKDMESSSSHINFQGIFVSFRKGGGWYI